MATAVFGGFDDLEVERVGYSSPKPPANQNGGFLPLDQALAQLPNSAPNIPSPFETNSTASSPMPNLPKKENEQPKNTPLPEIIFEPKVHQAERSIETKTYIGGIDHLEFKREGVLTEKGEILEEKEVEKQSHPATPEQEVPKLQTAKVDIKKVIKDEVVEKTIAFGKRTFKESKELYSAVLELGKMIFFKAKSKEQLAKEQERKKKEMEKATNKKSFFQSLRNIFMEHQSKKMKQRMENRKRLNIVGLAPEQANQLLGEKRNTSFEDLESDYYDEQTAIGMFYKREAERKAKAQAEAKAKGTDLTSQFSQARFAGERGAGHNAQSATG